MSEKTEQFTYEEMQKALALHVWKNEHLREEIMKDPKGVIERELGVKFDDSIKLNVVNQTESNQVTFVLPYNIHKVVGQELSDDQLEEVAGGASFGSTIKGLIKSNAPMLGKIAAGKLGDGLIAMGAPPTGLSETLGESFGNSIAKRIK